MLLLISILINFNTRGMESRAEEVAQFQRRQATERLYYAVFDNKTDEASRLLNSGLADPNSTKAKDYQNETMLQKAVENNNEALTRLLLSKGAKPNLKAPYGLAFPLDEAAEKMKIY